MSKDMEATVWDNQNAVCSGLSEANVIADRVLEVLKGAEIKDVGNAKKLDMTVLGLSFFTREQVCSLVEKLTRIEMVLGSEQKVSTSR